MTKQNY